MFSITMEKPHYPEPVVGAFVFNEDNELLLSRSNKWKGKWVIPGGHVELGESLEKALIREVKEEVNLEVRVEKLVLVQEAIFDNDFWEKKHFIFFDYKCKKISGEVKLNEELQSYGWFELGDALKKETNKYTKRTIEKLIKEI